MDTQTPRTVVTFHWRWDHFTAAMRERLTLPRDVVVRGHYAIFGGEGTRSEIYLAALTAFVTPDGELHLSRKEEPPFVKYRSAGDASATVSSKIAPLVGAVVAVLLAIFGTGREAHSLGTPEQIAACTPDAWRLCARRIPAALAGSPDRLIACMIANKSRLGPACQKQFDPK